MVLKSVIAAGASEAHFLMFYLATGSAFTPTLVHWAMLFVCFMLG